MKIKFRKIKYHCFVYILLLALYNSCSESPGGKEPIQNKVENNITSNTNKAPSTFTDTLKINSIAAVFYSPDPLQLKKIKSSTDPRVFEGSMHEYFYLMRNAHLVIRKYYPELKIIEAKNVRYLLFIKADKSRDCIDLDTEKDAYGLFIFNSKKAPELADMANIDTELGFYFTK